MASATKIPVKAVAALAAAAIVFGVSRVNLKILFLNTVTGPGSVSRIVALLVVIANYKNFPFVWHYRVFSALLKHFEFDKHKFSPTGNGPSSLFLPAISLTHTPMAESDYNFHKSNSTYFTDLDITRSHIVPILMREGIKKLNTTPGAVIGPDGVPAIGRWGIMLGAVQCNFKKEVPLYEPYEVWSRILCWDRKWMYIVSHFVKKGTVRPIGYTLSPPSSSLLRSLFGSAHKKKPIITAVAATGNETPEKDSSATTEHMNGNGHRAGLERDPKIPHDKVIFASAISKYVMKLGRLTVHPEAVMDASGLLPPRPGGWNSMSGVKPGDGVHGNGHVGSSGAADVVSDNDGTDVDDVWDWRRIEAENAKGMEFAKHFAALDGLTETFTGESRMALGVFRDIF